MNGDTARIVVDAVGGTAVLGQVFLILARTMPPPKESCGFAYRWFHDFLQGLAQNLDKLGTVQDPDKPVGQAKQTISATATTVDTPKGIDLLAVVEKEK